MDRRKFLKGVASAAVLAVLPGTEKYTHKTYGTAHYVIPREALENAQLCPADLSERSLEQLVIEIADKRAHALAFSMRETKEYVAANVFNRYPDGISLRAIPHPGSVAYKTWWDPASEFLHVESISREEMYRA